MESSNIRIDTESIKEVRIYLLKNILLFDLFYYYYN